jgi:hypothetical protein
MTSTKRYDLGSAAIDAVKIMASPIFLVFKNKAFLILNP